MRCETAWQRGDYNSAMQVDSVESESGEKDVSIMSVEAAHAFSQGMLDAAEEWDYNVSAYDVPIAALYKKGFGKGKGGKGSWGGQGGRNGGKNGGKHEQGQGKGYGDGDKGGKGYGTGGANGGGNANKKSDSNDDDKVCNWCHLTGHIAKYCRKRIRGEPRKEGRRPAASIENKSGDWTEADKSEESPVGILR